MDQVILNGCDNKWEKDQVQNISKPNNEQRHNNLL